MVNTTNGTIQARHEAEVGSLGKTAAQAQQLLGLWSAKADALRLRTMRPKWILLRTCDLDLHPPILTTWSMPAYLVCEQYVNPTR